MADGQASAQGPSSSQAPGSNALFTLEFTNEQICELENIFCLGQYSEDEGALQQIIGRLSTDFASVSAAFVEAWFRQRAADGQAPTTVEIQASQQAAAQMSAAQRARDYHLSHDPDKFCRQKKGFFKSMERFAAEHPGADILVIMNSPCSLFMWADGRGPYMNADSVLKASAESVAAVLKEAAARSKAGTLDWQQDPGQRYSRGTAHKGGGYMLWQADYRPTAIAELRAAGIPLKKGVVDEEVQSSVERHVQRTPSRLSPAA